MQSDDLKDAGLKATQPRLKILSILEQNRDQHMSAEDVYRALMATGDDLGLATIYRVLTQFESAGLVIRHHFAEGHAVFELDSGEHHDHIVCIDCGQVNRVRRQHHRAPANQDCEGTRLPARRPLAGDARALRAQGLRAPPTLIRAAPVFRGRPSTPIDGAPCTLRGSRTLPEWCRS